MSELDEETTEAIKQTVQTAILEGFEELSDRMAEAPKESSSETDELREQIEDLRAEIEELSYTSDYRHIRGYQ